ncbi:MAG: amidohydrolase [Lachnospiraceae bacterium]|jgi:amidohydrolase|nr:amidohydrolase [Lachnospiraceae bacterium]
MDQEILKKITKLRHELHANPELSMQEVRTKQRLMAFLRENTSLSVVDRGRWFYAYYPCGKEDAGRIAFRADFDALPMEEGLALPYASNNPGVSHKCGHDGHSAALCGLAMELERRGAGQDVYLIFQHAEEIGAGGADCAGLLAEKQIGQVYAFHNRSGYPQGSVILKEGVAQCTSKGLTVQMTGKPAHASQPEDGKNPAAALARLVLLAEGGEAAGEYDGFVLNTVVHVDIGSPNFGIAAAEGRVSMTLRADYEADLQKLETKIRAKARALADETGLSVRFAEQDFFPETVNTPGAVAAVRKAAIRCGFPIISMEHSFRASEDFGYYVKACPGAIVYIGNGEDYPQIHTREYDFNDAVLETAVELFAELARSPRLC